MAEKTPELLINILNGQIAFQIGLTKGNDGAGDVDKLEGSATWNKLCFIDGVAFKVVSDTIKPIANPLIAAAFIAWLKSVFGIKEKD